MPGRRGDGSGRGIRVSRSCPIQDQGAGHRVLPAGSGLPELRQRRVALRSARIRHLWRCGRRPRPRAFERGANAGGHNDAHRPRAPECRPATCHTRAPGTKRPRHRHGAEGRSHPQGGVRSPRPHNRRDSARHPGPGVRRLALFQGPVRIGRPHGALHVRPHRSRQGHRVRHRGVAAHRPSASGSGVRRLGRDASPSPRARRREVPAEPATHGRRSRGCRSHHLRQPLRVARRAAGVHRGDRHLPDAVPERSADHLGIARVSVWLRKGRGLHPLLAREGAAR